MTRASQGALSALQNTRADMRRAGVSPTFLGHGRDNASTTAEAKDAMKCATLESAFRLDARMVQAYRRFDEVWPKAVEHAQREVERHAPAVAVIASAMLAAAAAYRARRRRRSTRPRAITCRARRSHRRRAPPAGDDADAADPPRRLPRAA